jgi:8-oxo-dGTP diphosphatase
MPSYQHPRAALTVDCVVFGFDEQDLKVLLIERDLPPFAGQWALPGGFVHIDETLEQAARRELAEETGVSKLYLEQLFTFGALDRDPRERVVSVAYYALVKLSDHRIQAATDARSAAWFPLADTPSLAFDHDHILQLALERLKGKERYEAVLETTLDKRNFRKKLLAMGILEELDEIQQDVAHRAARLYRFDRQKYRDLAKQGFHFEL